MNFYILIHPCNQQQNQEVKHSQNSRSFSHATFQSVPSPLSYKDNRYSDFCHRLLLLVSSQQTSITCITITQYFSFQIGLFFFFRDFVNFAYVIIGSNNLLFFIVVFHCMNLTLFTHLLLIDTWTISSLQLLRMIPQICLPMSFWGLCSHLSWVYTQNIITKSQGRCMFIANLFSKVALPFAVPPVICEISSYSTFSPTLVIVSHSNFSHSSGYVVAHCGFNLHFCNKP